MIDFRTARTDDIPALLDLWAVAGENNSRPIDSVDALRALLERDPEAVIIAADGRRLVGSIIAGWDGWRAHLYRLAVHPDARRRGIAGELLVRAERRLIDLGASRLDAMVLDGNELGRSWWAGHGYTRQENWSRWVRPAVSDRLP